MTQTLFHEDYELALTYVEVLSQILNEGYGFVHDELLAAGSPMNLLQPDVMQGLDVDGFLTMFDGDSQFVLENWDKLFANVVDLTSVVDPRIEKLRVNSLF